MSEKMDRVKDAAKTHLDQQDYKDFLFYLRTRTSEIRSLRMRSNIEVSRLSQKILASARRHMQEK